LIKTFFSLHEKNSTSALETQKLWRTLNARWQYLSREFCWISGGLTLSHVSGGLAHRKQAMQGVAYAPDWEIDDPNEPFIR
jgi:hypothetical protein